MKSRNEFTSEKIGEKMWAEYLRTHFAAMAMQGMLANDWQGYCQRVDECDGLATAAVNFADALIEALNKSVPTT